MPFGFMILFPAASISLVLGVGTSVNPTPWVVATLFVPTFAFAHRQRERLAGADDAALAPGVRSSMALPTLPDLWRQPITTAERNIRHALRLPALARQDRKWDRDQGLR